MSAVTNIFEQGPISYQVSESVTGGQLVEPDTSNAGMVHPAAAGSVTVLGVALSDAEPNNDDAESTTSYGAHFTDASWPRPEVAVAYRGVFRLTAGSDLDFGELVVAKASGAVTAYTAGTSTFDAVVGRCVEPAGVTSGSKGKIQVGSVGSA